jgi:hypothetical protein
MTTGLDEDNYKIKQKINTNLEKISYALDKIALSFMGLNNRLADMELLYSLKMIREYDYSVSNLADELVRMRNELKEKDLKGIKDLIPESKREKLQI